MKFKNTFNVFVDNFPVVYKHLLYRLVVALIAFGLYAAVIYPFANAIFSSAEYNALIDGLKEFVKNLINGNASELGSTTEKIKNAFESIVSLISKNSGNIIWGVIGFLIVYMIKKFFMGLGNYATSAVICDKMALRAKSPFIITLVRNLKKATLYNLIYVPLATVYELIVYAGMYLLIFWVFGFVSFWPIKFFFYVAIIIVALSLKMVFTTDWIPALIRGQMSQRDAFVYTFKRTNKHTADILSHYVILSLIIYFVNVVGAIFTFGAAALITIPASYVLVLCFELVNYYDREELKYFIDNKTIVKPEKEHTLSREEFFKGKED
jgi:hypothetical protein